MSLEIKGSSIGFDIGNLIIIHDPEYGAMSMKNEPEIKSCKICGHGTYDEICINCRDKAQEKLFMNQFKESDGNPCTIARPTWDEYFMFMAYWTATRSRDPNTRNGAVIVEPTRHKIISIGYNGYPSGCFDNELPTSRPDKYKVILHAEDNAILNADGRVLAGSILYCTSYPCVTCWARIIQVRVSEVVYGGIVSKCVNEEDKKLSELLLKGSVIKIRQYIPQRQL